MPLVAGWNLYGEADCAGNARRVKANLTTSELKKDRLKIIEGGILLSSEEFVDNR